MAIELKVSDISTEPNALSGHLRLVADDATGSLLIKDSSGGVVTLTNALLQAFAELTTVADRLPYFSGVDTISLATFTGAARTLLAAADAAAQRTVLSVYSTTQVDAAIAALVNSAPSTLDTLKELSDALGADPNFATTVTASIAAKLVKANNLSDLTSASTARTNLGLGALAVLASVTESEISLSDVTTNNATTARHGFLKKLSNTATEYMDGTGAWSTPAGGGSLPAWIANNPDATPASPDVADDEFDTGSSLDTAGTRFSGATAWATVNPSTTTYTVAKHRLTITTPAVGGGNNLRIAKQTLPGVSAWRYETNVTLASSIFSNHFGGILLRESATGKLSILALQANSAGLNVFHGTGPTSFTSAIAATNSPSYYGPLYMAIELSGSNYFFEISWNGKDWQRLQTEAKTAAFTTAADEIGLGCDANNSSNGCVLVSEWFRRVA